MTAPATPTEIRAIVREEWCDFGDLPAAQCACVHCKPDVNEYADVQISYRFYAQFSSTIDCGHRVAIGDEVAKTVDGEHVCERCSR